MTGINWVGFYTLTYREVGRFFTVYRQTVLPGLISSALYILIFGFTLERRISEIDGVPYTLFILPGLIMMNTLTNASSNTSSSMLQMKLLQQLPDILTAPLSSLEICLAYIIGGTVRGMVNGILVMLLGVLLIDMPVQQPLATIGFILCNGYLFSIHSSSEIFQTWKTEWNKGLLAAVATTFSYGLICVVLQFEPISPIVSLRQVSVLLVVYWGCWRLGEPYGRMKLLAGFLIIIAIILISIVGGESQM